MAERLKLPFMGELFRMESLQEAKDTVEKIHNKDFIESLNLKEV